MTSGYVQVFVDGAARYQGSEKPNEAACAVVITRNKKTLAQFAQGLGNVSNNHAEYQALISGLLICSMANFPMPIIYSDSLVVVNHTNDVWKCTSHELLPLYITVKEIQAEFGFTLVHAPRSKVFMADHLCNVMLDKIDDERKKIPIKTIKVVNELDINGLEKK